MKNLKNGHPAGGPKMGPEGSDMDFFGLNTSFNPKHLTFSKKSGNGVLDVHQMSF